MWVPEKKNLLDEDYLADSKNYEQASSVSSMINKSLSTSSSKSNSPDVKDIKGR